jgi:site-specific DNA-methyltransferase (adenine-specific)
MIYNMDCVEGMRRFVDSDDVDLIIADPPFGIGEEKFDAMYNRDEQHVIDGYCVAPADYYKFCVDWLMECYRTLRPGGTIYVVSGYTHLIKVLGALEHVGFDMVNHIIWKYNFGVYTTRKFVSSHYHILYYTKRGGRRTFNERFADTKQSYADREDVWEIKRDYQQGGIKTKNRLPVALIYKMIQYSSDEGDLICDPFLGSGVTVRCAKALKRNIIGFERSREVYENCLS